MAELTPQEVAERMLHSAELLSEMQMNTPVDDDIIALEDAVDVLKKVANGELVPAPVRCGECRFRICNNKCGLDEQPRRDFDDDDFCSYGERMGGDTP